MKSSILGAASLAFLMMSCVGDKSLQDVNVSELETACDCAEAMVIGMKAEQVLKDLGAEEQEKAVEQWESKMKEITMHCRETKKFDMKEIRECEVKQSAKKELSK